MMDLSHREEFVLWCSTRKPSPLLPHCPHNHLRRIIIKTSHCFGITMYAHEAKLVSKTFCPDFPIILT
jgi:hypothetical protein